MTARRKRWTIAAGVLALLVAGGVWSQTLSAEERPYKRVWYFAGRGVVASFDLREFHRIQRSTEIPAGIDLPRRDCTWTVRDGQVEFSCRLRPSLLIRIKRTLGFQTSFLYTVLAQELTFHSVAESTPDGPLVMVYDSGSNERIVLHRDRASAEADAAAQRAKMDLPLEPPSAETTE